MHNVCCQIRPLCSNQTTIKKGTARRKEKGAQAKAPRKMAKGKPILWLSPNVGLCFMAWSPQTSCNTLQRHTKLKFHQRNYAIKGLRSAKRDHLKIIFDTFSEIVNMATYFIYIYKLSRILVDEDSHVYSSL